jgi:beta-lactam-binding protein with PASTA domain
MKIATGKVVEGKVVLEGERLAEGTVVTVMVREGEDAFDVSDEDERALLEALAQADRGQVVSWDQLQAQLRRSL